MSSEENLTEKYTKGRMDETGKKHTTNYGPVESWLYLQSVK